MSPRLFTKKHFSVLEADMPRDLTSSSSSLEAIGVGMTAFHDKRSILTTIGLGVSVVRSCIINMIFFSNFELVKKQINGLDV